MKNKIVFFINRQLIQNDIYYTYNLDISVSIKRNKPKSELGGKEMKLTLEGIKDCEAWKRAGITLPGYDVEKVSEKAKEEPGWVHFGIGNIFRIWKREYLIKELPVWRLLTMM